MVSITPTPQTWTLRLKSRKTTVLLHIDPLFTFSTIKEHLYTALRETGGVHDPDTGAEAPLPESAQDIQLGRPLNINDASQGFQLGEWEYSVDGSDGDGDVKGKGKAKAVSKQKKAAGGDLASAANIKDCPKGAGIKDGAVLAFRWHGDGIFEGEEDWESNGEPNLWGVSIPSFEDSYGVENEGDVGGVDEFEG